MIVVTGASGQLGRFVIDALLASGTQTSIVAVVRDPAKVADLAARGVEIRQADYAEPDALKAAFAGADKLLLISSSAVGQRAPQHANVVAAAKAAGVRLLAYTSILQAADSPLPLALEHQQTEAMLAESGLPYVLLRNGWYTENYTGGAAGVIAQGVLYGCAGDGRIAAAPRADYAAAAAAVLLSEQPQAGQVYELAGDTAFTLSEYAAELARQSGSPVRYENLDEAAYQAALEQAGLPLPIAQMLAQSETGASKGGLFDDSHTLSALIGRSTEAMVVTLARTLAAA